MGLYAQYFYEEQGINALKEVETIYKLWQDIGRNGMKIFNEGLFEEMDPSFVYHLLEESIIINEEEVIVEGCDVAELKKKRLEVLSHGLCWNLKLIGTKEFMEEVKNLEEYIYSSGTFKGERISKRVKFSFASSKLKDFFDEFGSTFNVYEEKENSHDSWGRNGRYK
jgi:hypothetical protein